MPEELKLIVAGPEKGTLTLALERLREADMAAIRDPQNGDKVKALASMRIRHVDRFLPLLAE